MKKNHWEKRIRRLLFNLRRNPITFVGDEDKPYRTALLVLAAVVFVLILALAGREEPQLMSSAEVLSLQERGVLRVGVRYDMPGIAGPDGGLEQELAQLLAQRILPDADPAASLDLVEVNAMTLGPKLDDGGVDIAIAMASSSMASKYSYSIPYYSDPCLLVARTGTPSFVLESMEIGVVQSNRIRVSPEYSLLKAYSASHASLGLKEKAYASYPDMLDALVRGEVRAVLLTELFATRYAQSYPITATAFSFGTVDYAICAASDSSAFAQISTLLLEELKADNKLLALYQAHGLNPDRIPAEQDQS
ncbi:MAG: transporter substrate-binding domain-containing protein [Candidatus Pelethousia sp.]|nr:transporter substrate-binding domain-containing protein [Candidatus Pelethousia sp.]